MMENYLEYLEKLQSKMDFRKSVDDKKVKFYFDMKNVKQNCTTNNVIYIIDGGLAIDRNSIFRGI